MNNSSFSFISKKSNNENSESTESLFDKTKTDKGDFTVDLLLSTKEIPKGTKEITNYNIVNSANGKVLLPKLDNNNVYSAKKLFLKSKSNIESLFVTINDEKNLNFTDLSSPDTNYILEDLEFKAGDNIKFLATFNDGTTKEKILKIEETTVSNEKILIESSKINYDYNINEYFLEIKFKDPENFNGLDNKFYESTRVLIDGFNYNYSNNLTLDDNNVYTFKLPINSLDNSVFKKDNLNIGIYGVDSYGSILETYTNIDFNKVNKTEILKDESIKDGETFKPNKSFTFNITSDSDLSFDSSKTLEDLSDKTKLSHNTLYASILNIDTNEYLKINEPIVSIDNATNKKNYKLEFDIEMPNSSDTTKITNINSGNYTLKIVSIGSYEKDNSELEIPISVENYRPYIETSLDEDKIYNSDSLDINFIPETMTSKSSSLENNIDFKFKHHADDEITTLKLKLTSQTGIESDIDALKSPNLKLDKSGKYKISIEKLRTKLGYTELDLSKRDFTINYDVNAPTVDQIKLNTNSNTIISENPNILGKNEVPGIFIDDNNFSSESFNNFLQNNFKVTLTNKDNPDGKVLTNVTLASIEGKSGYYYLKTTDDSNLENGIYKFEIDSISDDAMNTTKNLLFEFKLYASDISSSDISYTLSYTNPNSSENINTIDPILVNGVSKYYFNDSIFIKFNLPENYVGYKKAKFMIKGNDNVENEISTSTNISGNTVTFELPKYKVQDIDNYSNGFKGILVLESNANSPHTYVYLDLVYDNDLPIISFFDSNNEEIDSNPNNNKISLNSNSLNFKFNEFVNDSKIKVVGGNLTKKDDIYTLTGNSEDKEQLILLTIDVTDYAGNNFVKEYQIYFDQVAPTINARFPKNNLNKENIAVYKNTDASGSNINFKASLYNNDLPTNINPNDFILNINDFDIADCSILITKFGINGQQILSNRIDLSINNSSYINNLFMKDNEYYKIKVLAKDNSGNSSKIYEFFLYSDYSDPIVNFVKIPSNFNNLDYDSIINNYKVSSVNLADSISENPNTYSYPLKRGEELGVLIKDLTLNYDDLIKDNFINYFIGTKSYNANFEILRKNIECGDNHTATLLKLNLKDLENLKDNQLQGVHRLNLTIADALNSRDYGLAFYIDDSAPEFDYNFKSVDDSLVYCKDGVVAGNGRANLNINLKSSQTPYKDLKISFNGSKEKVIDLSNLDISKSNTIPYDFNLKDYIDYNNPNKPYELSIEVTKSTGISSYKTITVYYDNNSPIANLYFGDKEIDKISSNNNGTTIDTSENENLYFKVMDNTLFDNLKIYNPSDSISSNDTNYISLKSIIYDGKSDFNSNNVELIKDKDNTFKIMYKNNNKLNELKLNAGKYVLNFEVKDYAGNLTKTDYIILVENKNPAISLIPSNNTHIENGIFYIKDGIFNLEAIFEDTYSKYTDFKLEFFDTVNDPNNTSPLYTINKCDIQDCNLSTEGEKHIYTIPSNKLVDSSVKHRKLTLKTTLTCENNSIGTNGKVFGTYNFIYDNSDADLSLSTVDINNPNTTLNKINESDGSSYFTIQERNNLTFKVSTFDEDYNSFIDKLKIYNPGEMSDINKMANLSINLISIKFNGKNLSDSSDTNDIKDIKLKKSNNGFILEQNSKPLKLTRGKYCLNIAVKDIAGNITEKSYNLVVDNMAPKLKLNASDNSYYDAKTDKYYVSNKPFYLNVEFDKTYSGYESFKMLFIDEETGKEIVAIDSCENSPCDLSSDKNHRYLVPLGSYIYNNKNDKTIKVKTLLKSKNNNITTLEQSFNFIYDQNGPEINLNANINGENKVISPNTDGKFETLDIDDNINLHLSSSDKFFMEDLKTYNPDEMLDLDKMPNSSINLLYVKHNNTGFNENTNDIKGITISKSYNNSTFNILKDGKPLKLQQGKYVFKVACKDFVGNLSVKEYVIVVDQTDLKLSIHPSRNVQVFDNTFYINDRNFDLRSEINSVYSEYSVLELEFFDAITNNHLCTSSILNPAKGTTSFISTILSESYFKNKGLSKIKLVATLKSKNNDIKPKKVEYNFVYDDTAPYISIKENNTSIPEGVNNYYPYYKINPDFEVNFNDLNIDKNTSTLNDKKPNSLSIRSYKFKDVNGNNPKSLNNFEIVRHNDTFKIVPKNGATYNFENGHYSIELEGYDKSNNIKVYTFNFAIDKQKAEIFNLNLNSLKGSSVNNHKGVYYVNGDFNASFNITDTFAPHTELNVTLLDGNTTIQSYNVKCSKHNNCNGDLSNNGGHDIKSTNSFDFNYKSSNNLRLVIELKTSNGFIETKTINIRSEQNKPSLSLKYNNDIVDYNEIFNKSSKLDIILNDNENNIDFSDLITTTNSNNTKINSLNLKAVTVEDLYSTSNITDKFTLGKSNSNKLTLYSNNSEYNLPTGKYKIQLEAMDLCGNRIIQEFSFIVDTKKTSGNSNLAYKKINSANNTIVNIANITDTIYVPYNATLTLNLDGNVSGFKNSSKVSVRDINGNECIGSTYHGGHGINANGSINENKNSKSLTLFFDKDGVYEISWVIEAKNNISSYRDSVTVVVDTKDPEINLNMNGITGRKDDILFTNKTNHYLNYNVNDTNFDRVSNLSYKNNLNPKVSSGNITSELLNEGEYNITLTAEDKAGRSTTKTLKLVVDRTAPNISMPSETNFNSVNGVYYTNKVVPYNYNVTDKYLENEGASVNGRFYNKLTSIVGDGTKVIKVMGKDIAGNVAEKEFTYILDTVAPIISYKDIEIGKYYNRPVKPSFTSSDEHFNSESLSVTLNGTKYNYDSITVDGNYTFNLTVTDFAGNTSNLKVPFIIDTVAPIITISGILQDKANSGTLRPIISVDDKEAILTSLLNGDDYYGGPIIGNGKFSLIATAIDKAGNLTRKVVTFMLDSFLPDIIIEGIEDGGKYSSAVYPKISTERGADLKILLNGKPYDNKPIKEPGEYVFEITSTDKVGNVNKSILSFSILAEAETSGESFIEKLASPEKEDIPLLAISLGIGVSILLLLIILAIIASKKRKKDKVNNTEQ